MRPRDLFDVLVETIPAGLPTMVVGPSGIGKSSIYHAAAAKVGYKVLDYRLLLRQPTDFGFPWPQTDGTVKWCVPDELPKEAGWLILLDEFPQAKEATRLVASQLLWEGKIGEYHLPKGCAVAAAGNRIGDNAGAQKLHSHSANRFAAHIELDYDTPESRDDWDKWAGENGVDLKVRGYLKYKPQHMHMYTEGANAWPSRRTWTYASKLLNLMPESLIQPTIMGCVGEGCGAEFMGFINLWGKLPDIDECLRDPERASVPKGQGEEALCYAMACAVAGRAKGAAAAIQDAIVTYLKRFPKTEIGAFGITDAIRQWGDDAANVIRRTKLLKDDKWRRLLADIACVK